MRKIIVFQERQKNPSYVDNGQPMRQRPKKTHVLHAEVKGRRPDLDGDVVGLKELVPRSWLHVQPRVLTFAAKMSTQIL